MPPKVKSKKPSKPKQNTMIPLECRICPKNPNFSDISHLLTHVSSKSHLASQFKLQIRATSDQDAQETLEEYHNWYQNNNLDSLLSERLAIKEKKNTIKKRYNEANRALVPQMKREPVKKETSKKEDTPRTDEDSIFQKTPQYRAPVPRMHLFRAASGSRKGRKADDDDDDEFDPITLYETPGVATRASKRKNNKRKAKIDDAEIHDNVDPDLNRPPVHADSDPDSPTQLKGIFWPGMDLFDSASTGMRKKRNQKKEAHVTEHMMAVSQDVAPNEVSYFADWGLRASKDMFNDPLSDIEFSPEPKKKSKAASPKKRKVRKSAMTDVSVNVPRPRATRRAKAAVTGSPMKKDPVPKEPSSVAVPPDDLVFDRGSPAPPTFKPAPTLNPLAAAAPSFGNNVFVPSAEETLEFKMAIGNMKPKSPFSIFHDASEPSPARTEASLEENRFDFPNHGLPAAFGMNYSSSFISPTPAPKISAMRFHNVGKEPGKSDLPGGIQSVRRPVPMASHVLPPQVFYDAAYNPLFLGNHPYTQPFGYGDPQLNFKDNMKPSGFGSGFHSEYRPASSLTRAISSQESHQLKAILTNNGNTSDPSPSNVGMQFSMH